MARYHSNSCLVSPDTVRCIFSTDIDVIDAVVNLITHEGATEYKFTSLIHDCFSISGLKNISSISMCLPLNRPNKEKKYFELFKVDISCDDAKQFLFNGRPLTSGQVASCLDYSHLKAQILPILKLIMSLDNRGEKEGTFLEMVRWYQSKLINFLRKLLKTTSSTQWFITTFGQDDLTFTLVIASYYFYKHACTVETLMHLARLFCGELGHSLIDVSSLQELGLFFSSSSILDSVPLFAEYVETKLNIDTLENEKIDQMINEIRGGLLLSNKDIVQFVYLAFYACFNKTAFLEFIGKTSPDNINTYSSEILHLKLCDEFLDKMSSYYNKEKYIHTHLLTKVVRVPGASLGSYGDTPGTLQAWFGQTSDLTALFDSINEDFPFYSSESSLKELLKLASLSPQELDNPKDILFPEKPICPTYRSEFKNKTYFVMVATDSIEDYWKKHVIFPHSINLDELTDVRITELLTYCVNGCTSNTVEDNLMVSRHEYFNPHLPIYNVILDFDLPVEVPGYKIEDIYNLCLQIRQDIITVLSTILNLEMPPSHPVYFFKSECNSDIYMEPRPFCTCSKKIGLRIITPLPMRHAIVGATPLITLARVINRTIRLNKRVCELFPSISSTEFLFDTGIYSQGRCIRLPHTYKFTSTGLPERLLKLFVCHPFPDKTSYVKNSFVLTNLLYHSTSEDLRSGDYNLILDIRDKDEDFLSCKTVASLPKNSLDIDKLEDILGCPVQSWIDTTLWPLFCEQLVKYLPQKNANELNNISFNVVSNNMLQLKPRRGPGFSCLTHQHRTKSHNVRLFITLGKFSRDVITATLMSQCFANKCNNNKPVTHCTVHARV
ncbi:DNA replication protein [Murine herpesvirus strain 4556]|uniref:56 protein n=2 Tax=Orthoherpesviridae TaxID=3044472 RepID=P88992_MHV68|nr:DNA replication protein [Murid gammaherpesvirus 4]AXP99133.1 DNA replication protein [synthetic construct]QJQ80241.1 DNA replication protein [Murine herpesvirus]UNZ86684.1 DNA replication protein [Murine herpesvirus strain 72]UNZ86761.1 DNA replication protein [Murine herpesvirus strain 4556]AAB66413.1 DNA replication protein [Murid gammaherpesvirus 4]